MKTATAEQDDKKEIEALKKRVADLEAQVRLLNNRPTQPIYITQPYNPPYIQPNNPQPYGPTITC